MAAADPVGEGAHRVELDESFDGHRRSRDADPRAEILRPSATPYPSTMNGSIGHTTFRLKESTMFSSARHRKKNHVRSPFASRGARRRHIPPRRDPDARAGTGTANGGVQHHRVVTRAAEQ